MFVIEKNVEGAVVLRYKNWSRDTEWKPSNDPNKGIVLLTKVCPFQIIKFLIDMPPPPPHGACKVSLGVGNFVPAGHLC